MTRMIRSIPFHPVSVAMVSHVIDRCATPCVVCDDVSLLSYYYCSYSLLNRMPLSASVAESEFDRTHARNEEDQTSMGRRGGEGWS